MSTRRIITMILIPASVYAVLFLDPVIGRAIGGALIAIGWLWADIQAEYFHLDAETIAHNARCDLLREMESEVKTLRELRATHSRPNGDGVVGHPATRH